MAGDVALTRIKYGLEDGEIIEIQEGDKIEGSGLDEETIDRLKEQGAIGAPVGAAAEVDRQELLDEIARLQGQLAEKQGTTAAQGPKQPLADDGTSANKEPAKTEAPKTVPATSAKTTTTPPATTK